MAQIARELFGGQRAMTPGAARFRSPGIGPWLGGCHAHEADPLAEGRHRLIAIADDLLNSAQTDHWLNLVTFAQPPAYVQSAALWHNFDWEGPIAPVREMAGLGDEAQSRRPEKCADSAISRWFRIASIPSRESPGV